MEPEEVLRNYDTDRTMTILRRMCKLSALVLLLAVATMLVGIMAVSYSDGKFPFNAGGGIIAGLMAAIMSICPMCMLHQAWRYEKYRTSSYDCCCMSLFFWGFFTVLGIIFGLAVNGIGAILGCYNRSKETGCWKNKDSQFALAILTLVLTIILLILISTIFIICCCNCSLIGDLETNLTSYNDTTNSRHTPERYIVGSNGHSIERTYPRFTESYRHTPDRRYGAGFNPSIIPSAPTANAQNLDVSNLGYTRQSWSGTASLNSDFNPVNIQPAVERHLPTYIDPPPSYYEVMEGDPMETPL